MPTAEEILRDLAAPDPEEPSGETDADKAPADSGDNTAIKAVRDWGKSWETKAKSLAKEVEELNKFKANIETERRSTVTKTVFESLGLNEKTAELYLKVNEGEPSAESIKQFAVDYGLVVDTEKLGTTEEKSKGFEPGGLGGEAPAGKVYDPEEAFKLALEDPAKFNRELEAGRVKLRTFDKPE